MDKTQGFQTTMIYDTPERCREYAYDLPNMRGERKMPDVVSPFSWPASPAQLCRVGFLPHPHDGVMIQGSMGRLQQAVEPYISIHERCLIASTMSSVPIMFPRLGITSAVRLFLISVCPPPFLDRYTPSHCSASSQIHAHQTKPWTSRRTFCPCLETLGQHHQPVVK